MLLARRALLAALGSSLFSPAQAQHRILTAEQTVELEHEDRVLRLGEALSGTGVAAMPRFSVTRVPRERMPANFDVSVPVLRLAFSERTFFDTASASVLPPGMRVVAAVSAAVRGEAPDAAVFVAGHTDDRGGEAYNHNLSVARANAVSDAMMTFGVGEVALWRVGFGESAPLYANDTDEHRSFNRRVEFLFGARVEPVVDVLSRQLESVCVSPSEVESARCVRMLPRRDTFEATQATARPLGVGLDGRPRRSAPTTGGRREQAPHPRNEQVVAQAPRSLTIPLIQTRTIAAPRR